ncbi:MAG TPA: TIGR04255 family protein, partial [Candidatus Kapabacteria bacterium]|nr:TIGR04255 family protein [Candidatus Kapabacteria bacterium]
MGLPTLENAPIVEAVLDIFVTLPPEVSFGQLRSIHQKVKIDFPRAEQRFESIIANLRSDSPTVEQHGLNAIRFKTEDGQRIFQARSDGFTFNLLERYDNWDSFYAAAMRLWDIYFDHVRPTEITSIGLRYVNRILLP